MEAARDFVRAIVWGEHTTVWELLSDAGRSTALSVARARGFDRVIASRIDDGVADPTELDEFQARLVGGLRRDLRSVDLEHLEPLSGPDPFEEGRVVVELGSPSTLPGAEPWSAGRLVLSADDAGRWRIDRLEPRLAGP